MRKLKLQMQTTINGLVASPEGGLSWDVWDWDADLISFTAELTASVGTILLGRKLAEGFLPHWEGVAANAQDPQNEAGVFFTEAEKIVFTRSGNAPSGKNTVTFSGNFKTEIERLKGLPGKDLMVYGGASFVASLLAEDLVDELFLYVNPTAISEGLSIFGELRKPQRWHLAEARSFGCGIVLLHYTLA